MLSVSFRNTLSSTRQAEHTTSTPHTRTTMYLMLCHSWVARGDRPVSRGAWSTVTPAEFEIQTATRDVRLSPSEVTPVRRCIPRVVVGSWYPHCDTQPGRPYPGAWLDPGIVGMRGRWSMSMTSGIMTPLPYGNVIHCPVSWDNVVGLTPCVIVQGDQ